MRKIPTIFTALILAGCSQLSPQNLRALNNRELELHTQQDYQAVYKKILDQERTCWESNSMGGVQTIARGDLYSETQTGTITLAIHSMYGVNTYHVIDIKADSPQTTTIHAWIASGDLAKYKALLQGWIDSNSTICKP